MFRKTLFASALAASLAFAAAASAQSPRMDATAQASANSGTMTAADVGLSPMTGTSSTDYVVQAANSDRYEIESSKVALHRSQRDDVKKAAQQMIDDHTTTTKALMAALNNPQRKLAKPSDMLSDDKASQIKLLKSAPKADFDTLYLTQQVQSHKQAWALQKGYATDGDDASLRQVAASAVPVVEMHLTMMKGLVPASAAGMAR